MLKYIQSQNFTFLFCIINLDFCTVKYDSVGDEKCVTCTQFYSENSKGRDHLEI